MRDFDPVIGVDGIDVFDRRHHLSMSRVITAEFIRKEPTRFAALAFDQAAKEAHRGLLVPSPLHKNINGVAILIDRTPEVLMFPLNGDDRFIQMPGIAQFALPLIQSPRISGAKLRAPLPHRFADGVDSDGRPEASCARPASGSGRAFGGL